MGFLAPFQGFAFLLVAKPRASPSGDWTFHASWRGDLFNKVQRANPCKHSVFSPVGTTENSPALQCWVQVGPSCQCRRHGRTATVCNEPPNDRLCRAYGTGCFVQRIPSTEVLGYCLCVPTGRETRRCLWRIPFVHPRDPIPNVQSPVPASAGCTRRLVGDNHGLECPIPRAL